MDVNAIASRPTPQQVPVRGGNTTPPPATTPAQGPKDLADFAPDEGAPPVGAGALIGGLGDAFHGGLKTDRDARGGNGIPGGGVTDPAPKPWDPEGGSPTGGGGIPGGGVTDPAPDRDPFEPPSGGGGIPGGGVTDPAPRPREF